MTNKQDKQDTLIEANAVTDVNDELGVASDRPFSYVPIPPEKFIVVMGKPGEALYIKVIQA